MSGFHIKDDFFSPIRSDTFADSSEDSASLNISNFDSALPFTGVTPNEFDLEDDAKIFKRQSQIQMNASFENLIKTESANISTPVSNKISSDSLNSKKLDKVKHLQDKNLKKENISKYPEQKDLKKKSLRSLPSSITTQCNIKELKAEKSISHSLKKMCIADKPASSTKHYLEKNPVDNLLDLNVNGPICKDEKSSKSKKRNAILNSENQKSNALIEDVENPKCAIIPPVSEYEASIEKIVHDCVSLECDKIRQNIYAQQMTFYRQINKLQAEMEEQHLATNGRLLKVIEELMLVNATLKSTSPNVKKIS